MNEQFYTYIDWTLEPTPRPFYIGKGNDDRITNYVRNDENAYIAKTLGVHREIAFKTASEQEAHAHEIELIAQHHTYVYDAEYNGIGCNRTKGGEGERGINAKPVLRCDFDGNVLEEFASVHDASLVAGSSLSMLLTGGRKLQDLNGSTWRYKFSEHIEPRQKYSTRANCKKLLMFDGDVLKRVYDSIADAAVELNVRRSVLSEVLHGKRSMLDLHFQENLVLKFDSNMTESRGLGRKMNALQRDSHSRALKGKRKNVVSRLKYADAHSKPVGRYDVHGRLVSSFPSMKIARISAGMSKTALVKRLRLQDVDDDGYVWRFIAGEE